MILNDYDLQQIDEKYLSSLEKQELLEVSLRMLKDLKEAKERINQNPTNSSRPPSSREPWIVAKLDENDQELDENSTSETEDHNSLDLDIDDKSDSDSEKEKESEQNTSDPTQRRKAGKQKGSPGYGRTQKLEISSIMEHPALECAACGGNLGEEGNFTAITGHYVIDIELGTDINPGIVVKNVKHLYGDTTCLCGHVTRNLPHRCEDESDWKVELTEWHLVGPRLLSLICCLSKRMHMSRPKVQEFLKDWLHLHLSIGTINQCIHEAGRAVEPLEERLIEEIIQSDLLHADETSWKENGTRLWLWVFLTTTVVLYVVGSRGQDVIINILGNIFYGWLMSDGYKAYRMYKKRLRCWAHLIRKARGLKESLDKNAKCFGNKVLEILNILIEGIYRVREGPWENLPEKYAHLLEELRTYCDNFMDYDHKKTKELAREFLNDWEAIFLVLAHPELPLTNNEAEQILRHWVINRKISYGTRTKEGSRAFSLLASIIDTCRKRNVSPWEYIADVVSERRQGRDAPPIPAMA